MRSTDSDHDIESFTNSYENYYFDFNSIVYSNSNYSYEGVPIENKRKYTYYLGMEIFIRVQIY